MIETTDGLLIFLPQVNGVLYIFPIYLLESQWFSYHLYTSLYFKSINIISVRYAENILPPQCAWLFYRCIDAFVLQHVNLN